jgi:hypothetical protein
MADIDKSLSQAPQGLEAMAMDQPDLSIEIENPEGLKIGMDGMVIDMLEDVGTWEGANVGRGPTTLGLGKPC